MRLIAAGGWCAHTDSLYDPSAYRVNLKKYYWCVACDENLVTSRGLTCTPCWHLAEVEKAIDIVRSGVEYVERDVAVRLLVEIEQLRERNHYLEESW